MYLIAHIDDAVKNEYIKVYYQPVVDINTNKLCGFEALARWDDPEHGFLPPFEFVGILEDAHLIQKLDLFMLKKICEKYRKETNLGHKCVPISFNLSRLDFKLSDIYKELTRLTKEYNVPHEMIHIEITESVLDGDEDGYIREQVTRFQKDGFEVWMDDFGSGFSSLNVLKDYDFDFLKIDMMFLRNFSEKSKVIIRAIVEMAKLLHIGTLSEGVETKEHLDFLKKIGCDRVQGYYYSKPLPYDEVMAVLKEKGVEV
jgi:EAL domain-containing protein (putative c-di-GMP-specific phosphodiesterase class I)